MLVRPIDARFVGSEIEVDFACPCGKTHSRRITEQEYVNRFEKGLMVQDALSGRDADFRETFVTGMCPACVERLYAGL